MTRDLTSGSGGGTVKEILDEECIMIDGEDPPPNPMSDFLHVVGWTLLAAWIGHKLDRTRFGIWFNNNRFIDTVYKIIGRSIILVFIILAVYYVILVIGQFMS